MKFFLGLVLCFIAGCLGVYAGGFLGAVAVIIGIIGEGLVCFNHP